MPEFFVDGVIEHVMGVDTSELWLDTVFEHVMAWHAGILRERAAEHVMGVGMPLWQMLVILALRRCECKC